MTTPHKHAKLIKLWADGKGKIQFKGTMEWITLDNPAWNDYAIYRLALPDGFYIYNDGEEPKQKVVRWQWIIKPPFVTQDKPYLTQHFFTEEEIKSKVSFSIGTIIGKAKWTRMEFDE